MTERQRLFAVIPAAGSSQRMGRPKLLLQLGGRTILARLLEALNRPGVTARIVVVRPDDEPLRREALAAGAVVVQPAVAPPEMRQSVEEALKEIRQRYSPDESDGWMLVPGDHPVLDREVIDGLLERWYAGDHRILVPTYRARRGHPTFFRWDLAKDVPDLEPGYGLNKLMKQHAGEVTELDAGSAAVTTDLDTPEDFEALRKQWSENDSS
jgi:molybdenum cofactor cytidylyltransferase